jgi:hypothetical protein
VVQQSVEGLMAGMVMEGCQEKEASHILYRRVTNDQGARVRHIGHHRSTIMFKNRKQRVCTQRMPVHTREIRQWTRRRLGRSFESLSFGRHDGVNCLDLELVAMSGALAI